jgi:hypothetical protein
MRLWSIHPEYLDAKGLVALWREALLAQNVLQCNTKGYKKHPLISLGSTSYQDFLPYWPVLVFKKLMEGSVGAGLPFFSHLRSRFGSPHSGRG